MPPRPQQPPRIAGNTRKKNEPRLVPTERRGYFYYDTAEQKELIEERARAANRSTSSYILNTILSSAGNAAVAEDQAQRLKEEAERWREDYWATKKERDELARRVEELDRVKQDLILQLEQAHAQVEAAQDGQYDLFFHDVEAWRILMRHQDPETSEYEPVLERNLIIELDVVEKPDYVRLLKERLQKAAELGLLERVSVRGKVAYKWNGAGPA